MAGWEGCKRLRTTMPGVNQPASHQGCRDRQPRKATYRPRHFQGPRLDSSWWEAATSYGTVAHWGPQAGRPARRKRPPGSEVPAGARCKAPSPCWGSTAPLRAVRETPCSGRVCIKAPSTCHPSEQLQSTPLSHRVQNKSPTDGRTGQPKMASHHSNTH